MRSFSARAAILSLAALLTLGLRAQEPGEQIGGRRQFAGMQRVTGVVSSVSGDNITVKSEDGTYQVATTANTRLMKGMGTPLKVAEVKAGDGIMALGNMDAPNKTLHAAMVITTDAEQVKKLRENLGKTFISGKVTAIDADNLKMTVMRTDGVAQTIGFDDTTSFKRGGRMRGQMNGANISTMTNTPAEGGESITLADIKVGDSVVGQGLVKNGVFVPSQLNVAAPRGPRGPRAEGSGSGEGTPQPKP